MQHYENSSRGRNLKEEQENDELKYELASINNIEKYIVVDARYSTRRYITDSIEGNGVLDVINKGNNIKIDWDDIFKSSEKSILIKANELWNKNVTIDVISKELKLSQQTIRNYLKRGTENGWSQYNPEENRANGSKLKRRSVVRFDDNGNYKHYRSFSEAERDTNVNQSKISDCCNGKRKSAGGYRWLIKEDYEKYINNEIKIDFSKKNTRRKIVQLSKDDNFIKEWASIQEAKTKLNFKGASSIIGCCKGRLKTAGGFKWMYLEDYENKLGKIS